MLKNATCEEALSLLNIGNYTRQRLKEQGVKNYSLGSISETFSNSNNNLCDNATAILRPFLLKMAVIY